MKSITMLAIAFSLFIGTGAEAQLQLPLLRLALLPTPDSIPIHVAEHQKLFEKEGVAIEILPVGSAVARDQLIQAGRADGMVNEILGAANFNRAKPLVQVVATARVPRENAPLFRILAAPESEFTTTRDLAKVPVGISKNTIIQYITEGLLLSNGVSQKELKFSSTPVLPERLQLLLSKQIKAATLPDPLAASAMAAGAVEIINDSGREDISITTLTFTKEVTEEKKEALSAFMRAWNQAAKMINDDPERWRTLFLQKIRVPKNIQQSYPLPIFPLHSVPTATQWNDVMTWMLEKKQLTQPLSYEESVTQEFLGR